MNHMHQHQSATAEIDPVCGMEVDPADAAGVSQHDGRSYYFCSPGCKKKFDANPAKYVGDEVDGLESPSSTAAVASAGATWTCPMHPEIVRDGPGSCPICGMALEPRSVTAEEEENPELIDMTRRFTVSLALTVPLILLTMGRYVPGFAFIDR